MKRHASLIPLSRFHRSILFLALVARENAPKVKGYPETSDGKISYAIEFYEKSLQRHFALEKKLWDYMGKKYTSLQPLIEELESERTRIVELFTNLASHPDEEKLFTLGPILESHVRREERELFQQIQQVATKSDFQWVDELLSNKKE